MHALRFEGELLQNSPDDDPDDNGEQLSINDRPTIPVPAPRDSGVRLKIAHIAWPAATVDVVMCDLSRDPRSEDYSGGVVTPIRRRNKKKRRRFGWNRD